jgi:uncharacterized tellurite resistance protein B-like protein
MSRFFGRLFSQATAEPDGFSQTQREAIVDLLHFCMCADDRLRPVEDRLISDEVARFTWEGKQAFESFSAASIERVGTALKTFATRAAFLTDVGERLGSPRVKRDSIDLCLKLFHVDGEYPDSERVIFREIRHVFGWPM